MLRNFFWNTWDNLIRILGLSAIGTLLNAPLIVSVVVLWGAAKLPPHKINPPVITKSEKTLFKKGSPELVIKEQYVTLLVNTARDTTLTYAVSTNGAPIDAKKIAIGQGGTHGTGKINLKAGEKKAIPLFSSYKAEHRWTIQFATGKGKPAARITIPAFTGEDAFSFLGRILVFLLLSLSFPSMAVLYHCARRLIEGTENGFFRELWTGLKKMFLPGTKLFLINALVYVIFYVAFGFYMFNLEKIIGTDIPPLRWVAIGITGWLSTFYTMLQFYLLPLLAHNPEEKLLLVFKKASLLVVDNVLMTFSVFLFTFVLFALSFFSLAIITVLLPGLIAMLHMTNFYILLRQYEPPEEDDHVEKDDSAEKTTRSWRTIFRPWED